MSDRPDNAPPTPVANWVTPRGSRRYTSQTPAPVIRQVKALPADLARLPTTDGAWHLPERTTFSADAQVDVRAPQVSPGLRPEDLLAQVLNTPARSTTTTREPARPEDTDFAAKPAAKPVAQAEATSSDEAATTLPADPLQGLEALGALDDEEDAQAQSLEDLRAALPFDNEDEDGFSVSEYMSALDLEQATTGTQESDTVPLGDDDLSPASQAALRARVQQARESMPAQQQESAAEYARRMASQLSREESPTLDMPSASVESGESAADVARRMAEQYTSAEPPAAATALTAEEEALAEKFRQTARGIGELRARYQRGEMLVDEVQQRQREYQIYDERTQLWWMMGIDSGKWYRYDQSAGSWVESEPPVPLTRPATPTATGQFRAEDIISGSLPYLPQQGAQEFSSQGQLDPQGDSGTPIPRPGQPEFDPNMTMIGEAASLQTLPNAAQTVLNMNAVDQQTFPNMNAVDSQYTMPMNTVPVAAVIDQPYTYAPMVEAPDYGNQNAPTFEKLRVTEDQQRGRLLIFVMLAIVGCGVLTFAASAAGLLVYYNNAIEPYQAAINGLADYRPSFQTARILDANGDLIVELNSQDGGARSVIPLEQMSPYVLHAVLSAENPTFYDDPGFDLVAIFRALLQNVGSGSITSGASTITQQLARNLILKDSSLTADRKLTEIMVAMAISQKYSKNDVLQLYMNEAFFGNQSYGVQAASDFYFGLDASELNMAQGALLAGIISSPVSYDPVTNFTAAKNAMYVVLGRMVDTGCIQFQHGTYAQTNQPFCVTPGTFVDYQGERAQLLIDNKNGTYGGLLSLQLAGVETRQYLPRASRTRYPHFVAYVQAQVEQAFGPNAMFQRGFTIYTTLNPRIQDVAQQGLANQVKALVNNGVNTGAVMVTDPQTGAIRAMVGSPDFNNEEIGGQVDNTRTWQQPGSAIKPILYTAALEGGPNGYLTPASILWDVPSSYPISGQQPYQPVNFSGVFYGPAPLRTALQNSYNVSAVKTFEFVGADKFVSTAQRMGLNFLPEAIFGLPSALGANEVRLIDMMKAYGTLADNGQLVPLYTIDRITEEINGETLEVPLPEPAPSTQAVSPQIAYLMQNILSDDAARAPQFGARGPLTLANIGIPTQGYVGAKTGTTNDGRDLWTMGFTSNTVVGVWLGTFDNAPTVGVTGSSAPAQLWNAVMSAAVSGRAPAPFNNPGGVVQNTVCRDTGTLAGANCANRASEIYIQTQPPPPDTQGFVQTIPVDSWTGYAANEWCSENVVNRTFVNVADPFGINWIVNTPQGRQWAQLVGLPQNTGPAPTSACAQGQVLPSVYLNNPTNNQQVTGTLTITGQISAPDFSRYEIEYASAAAPENFIAITTNTQQFPSAGSTLGTWDTTTVPNGSYILRLSAYSNAGGLITRAVTVNVANVQPTPTPQPIVTVTESFFLPTPIIFGTTAPLPIFGTQAPLPFDPSVQSTPTATLAP